MEAVYDFVMYAALLIGPASLIALLLRIPPIRRLLDKFIGE